MPTVNALVSIGTTANAGQIQTHASDGAYVAAKGSAAADGDYFYQTTDDVIRLFANGAWQSVAAGVASTAGQSLVANGSGIWSPAYPTGGPRVMNLGLAAATTTTSNDSIKIQGAAATLSASSPLIAVIPNSSTAGLLSTLVATSDVTIKLTGAHWGLGTNGDFTDVILRVYAINDAGTLKWGVSNRGGYKTITTALSSITATDINLQTEMLVNSALSATSTCFEVGWFLADFDDTGGAAEDLWVVQTAAGEIQVGMPAPVYTDWQTLTLTTGLTGGSHTVTAYEKIVGDTWFVRGRISFTSIFTGGSATLNFPSNRRLDGNKVHPMSTNYNRLGDATLIDTSNNSYVGCILYASTSSVQIQAVSDDGGNGAGFLTNSGFSTANPFTWTNDDIIDFYFSIPILGFSGN